MQEVVKNNSSTLTQHERKALDHRFNLSDGHAHQRQNEEQQQIIAGLSELFYAAETGSQDDIEHRFFDRFFTLAKQPKALDQLACCFPCYSASTATEIIAHILKRRGLKTALIEPTFDNIPAILRRVGVDLVPLHESILSIECDIVALAALNVQALFIVMPNNPTGCFMKQASFQALLDFCVRERILLVVDFCFRFFVEEMFWDQYALALASGLDFIFIEDTGKTWPTLDLKVGFITVSSSLYTEAKFIHNDFLLNVSPFIFAILEQYINLSLERGFYATVNTIVQENRRYLRRILGDYDIGIYNPGSQISVEWLEFPDVKSVEILLALLESREVHILRGSNFFWFHTQHGDRFIRIALMRDPAIFCTAIDILAEALQRVTNLRRV